MTNTNTATEHDMNSNHGIFSLEISMNGQASVRQDVLAMHDAVNHLAPRGTCYHHYENDGFRVDAMGADIQVLRATLASICPCSTLRVLKYGGVRVRFPAALVAAREAINSDWGTWVEDTTLRSHQLRDRAINHPAYLATA